MKHDPPMEPTEQVPKPLPTAQGELKPRPWWKRRRVRLGAALLLSLALFGVVMDHLTPIKPGRTEGFSTRVERYVGWGQARADLRTLGAAVRYLMQSESDLPVAAGGTNLPVAANPTPGAPKS